MKPSIAITLILIGGLLICAPILADYLHRAQIATLMAKPGITTAHLGSEMGDFYRFGCWIIGTLMILAAISSSRKSGGA